MKADEKRERIIDACMTLLETTSLETLRTQDLIEKAGVSRSTFYRLFPDKYEVASWVYKRKAEEIIGIAPRLSEWKRWTVILHTYMREHKAFFRNIAGYRGQNSFRDFLWHYFENNNLRYRNNPEKKLTKEQRHACHCFALIAAETTIDWIENGFSQDDDTMTRLNEACIPDCIRSFFE